MTDTFETTGGQTELLRLLEEQARDIERGHSAAPPQLPQQRELAKFAAESNGALDPVTVQRAFRLDRRLEKVINEPSNRKLYGIVRALSDSVPDARLLCLDLESLGGAVLAGRWLTEHRNEVDGIPLVAACRIASEDVTPLLGKVTLMIARPRGRGGYPWSEALRRVWSVIKGAAPARLSEADLDGGVSREAFADSRLQASLLDDDPRKRD